VRRARSLFAVLAIVATVFAGSSDPDGWGGSTAGSVALPVTARQVTPALDGLDGRRWAAAHERDGRRWTEASRVDGRRWAAGMTIDGRRWAAGMTVEGRRWTAVKVVSGRRWPAG
jgi:hypothetical protein